MINGDIAKDREDWANKGHQTPVRITQAQDPNTNLALNGMPPVPQVIDGTSPIIIHL